MIEEKTKKNPSQVGSHQDLNPGPPECEPRALPWSHLAQFWLLVSVINQKNVFLGPYSPHIQNYHITSHFERGAGVKGVQE